MPSETNQSAKYHGLPKETLIRLGLSSALAVFWVVFVWNFWDRGVYALGANFFVFLSLFLGVFIWAMSRNRKLNKRDTLWIAPLSLIILSFLLYDNPFLKVTSILSFPVLLAVFYNNAWLDDNKENWGLYFLWQLFKRALSFLEKIGESVAAYFSLLVPADNSRRKVIARVVLGLALFLIVAFLVFIPLLSAADNIFAGKMASIYRLLENLFSFPLVYKVIVLALISVLTFAMLLAWGHPFKYEGKGGAEKKVDSIISGIVLGGLLLLYLLFLWVQLERLWVGSLPFDFKTTEDLVKSGFWQLLLLSLINILIYFSTYRKTARAVQSILTGFTTASLLLLVSAAYRIILYVVYYGFSYEKFFAAYTVLYCAILFVWLISRLMIKRPANIVKFLVVLFFWMYALLVVFPVERFVLAANVRLARLEESRIRLFELSMLSPDVLSLVKEYRQKGWLEEGEGQAPDWQPWIDEQESLIAAKAWYEMNITNIWTRR